MSSAGPAEVLALAAVYGVPDAERDQYVALALQARQKGWWQRYGQDTLASNFEEYVGLESEAAEVREFAAELIPGLLQTERYATELIQAWIPQADEVVMKERADLRAQRQARLHETNPLTLGTVIHESALRQLVGGPEVMREQLKHLVASAKLPNVTLQVRGRYPRLVHRSSCCPSPTRKIRTSRSRNTSRAASIWRIQPKLRSIPRTTAPCGPRR